MLPCSHALPEPATDPPISDSHGFSVPDCDDDSASEQSREGSIQVIEFNPRAYSVPSSDDDDDSDINSECYDNFEIASSAGAVADTSAASTPGKLEKQQVAFNDVENDPRNKDVRGLNLSGPSLPSLLSKIATDGCSELKPSLQRLLSKPAQEGSTQLNPIHLEDTSTNNAHEPDGETDDEGPEVLPIRPSNETSIKECSQEEPFLRLKRSQASTADVREVIDLDIVLETQAVIPREQGAKSETKKSKVAHFEPAVSIADATDGSSSTDEDDEFMVEDDDFPIDEDEGLAYPSPLLQPCASTSAAYNPPYHVPRKEYELQTEIPSGASTAMLPQYGILNEKGKLGLGPLSQNDTCLIRRAASPSDAALARKPSSSGMAPSQLDQRQTVFGPKDSSGVRQERQRELVSLVDDTNGPYNIPSTMIFAENTFPKRSAYTSGPFSNGSNLESPVVYDADTSRTCYGSVDTGAASAKPSSSCGNHEFQHDNLSRLNISNLVHTYYAEHPSSSLKRKATKISSDNEIDGATQTTSSAPITTQETPLPDAQPRDAPVHMDTSISLGDDMAEPLNSSVRPTVMTEASSIEGPSLKRVREPFAQRNSVTQRSARAVSRIAPIEGPARKKARTSSSKSTRGVGKFVSGICVGVAGALAAFIATIPASVKEEALRELQSAA